MAKDNEKAVGKPNKEKVLIAEDERRINSFMASVLESNEYIPVQVYSGREAIEKAASTPPALILLDLGLPDIDGMEVLRRVREWSDVPVIVVSARQNESEKVKALDAGANDYVTKPFGNEELLARIRSALRIHNRIKQPKLDPTFRSGSLFIDYEKRMVTLSGKEVHLTPIEYGIVLLLSQNAGKVMTHDRIIENLWGPYASDSQLLRVNVANIRRKLEDNPADPVYIITEVGVGYKMAEHQPAAGG